MAPKRFVDPIRPVMPLVASTLIALEAVRSCGPAIDSFAGRYGVPGAAAVAVGAFGLVALAGVAGRWTRPRRAAWLAVLVAGAARLAVGFDALRTAESIVAAAVLALIALVLAADRPRGDAARAAGAVVVGIGIDAALRGGFEFTVDAVWRAPFSPGAAPRELILLGLLASVVWTRRDPVEPGAATGRVGLCGPILALAAFFAASPGFVASQSRVSVAAATILILTGACLAVAAVAVPLPRLVAGATLVVGVAALFLGDGAIAAAGAVMTVASLGAALSAAWGEGSGFRSAAWGLAWAGLGTGLGFVLVVLPYQANYETPLPFPGPWVPIAASVLIAAFAWRPTRTAIAWRGVAAAAIGLVLVAALSWPLAAATATRSTITTGEPLRLLTWNIHYGTGVDGRADPFAIRDAIAGSGANTVVLQEVSRGWPIGGGVDLASWLSRELHMRYVWSPAADGQFGNLILTALPVRHTATGRLPRGAGSMLRSYASATVATADGDLRVMTAHLQHRDTTPTRLAEIRVLLRAWGGAGRTVIAGDMNSLPGWPEIERFADAGFHNAQDDAGQGERATSPSVHPVNRVDWVFGTRDVAFDRFRLLTSTASDHLPLSVTVRPTTPPPGRR